MSPHYDTLWVHAKLFPCCDERDEFVLIEDGAIGVVEGKIAWLGPMSELDPQTKAGEIIDCGGKCLLPGLIDCHTHLIFAGCRANEFAERIQGRSYAEIAEAGGGIQATVEATRYSTERVLFELAAERIKRMQRQGVTTLEIKTGYGLSVSEEIKLLQVAARLAAELPITIQKTCLAAHAIPKEFIGNAEGYLDLVINEILPQAVKAELVDAVDIYCEHIAFNVGHAERLFTAAKSLNLPFKAHAEQLCYSGAAEYAARQGALSVDHLEYLDEAGVAAMAESGTVAVLLPGAYYTLKDRTPPPVKLLRQYRVPMAVATDCNPGSSPTTSLLLMLNMACNLFGLTPLEALLGVTLNAAKALGLSEHRGSLTVGKYADFSLWEINHPQELCYWFDVTPCVQLVRSGKVIS